MWLELSTGGGAAAVFTAAGILDLKSSSSTASHRHHQKRASLFRILPANPAREASVANSIILRDDEAKLDGTVAPWPTDCQSTLTVHRCGHENVVTPPIRLELLGICTITSLMPVWPPIKGSARPPGPLPARRDWGLDWMPSLSWTKLVDPSRHVRMPRTWCPPLCQHQQGTLG